MKKLILPLSFIFMFLILNGCENDDKLDLNHTYLGLGGEDVEWTELDQWIHDNYTVPYNMNVKYRWDRNEQDYDRTLIPPDESKIKPLLNAILKCYLEPYREIAGEEFIKNLCPKKYVLVGSAQYNSDGSIRTGFAEGGVKVTIYRVNSIGPNNTTYLRDILRTVHHEFGHIMHQIIKYPKEFLEITPGGYTDSWTLNTNTLDVAYQLGFISRYSRKSASEDFVELLSYLCLYGYDYFLDVLDQAGEEGAAALRKKETILVNYLKDTWNINLYDQGDVKGLMTLAMEGLEQATEDLKELF